MTTESRALAQQIVNQIDLTPELFDMSDWGAHTECGTTYCIAGWAAFLGEGLQPPEPAQQDSEYFKAQSDYYNNAPSKGKRLLGLDEDQADALFFTTDDSVALDAVRRYANGEPWEKALDEVMRLREAERDALYNR